MSTKTGVYTTKKKNGEVYYRASLTYKKKHISLGSFDLEEDANQAYNEARTLINNSDINIDSYNDTMKLPFDKFVIILNFRDNNIYFSTPIYIYRNYFEYYLTKDTILKFDRDDLFFYASHKIQQKGGYLFVSDYGSQYKILSRYGNKPFAVYGRDYDMIIDDKYDFRYSNIRIINNYTGVLVEEKNGKSVYTAVIHKIGNHIIGRYDTEEDAAIAYNKAVDTLHNNGIKKNYIKNYIISLKSEEYKKKYDDVVISDKIYEIKA